MKVSEFDSSSIQYGTLAARVASILLNAKEALALAVLPRNISMSMQTQQLSHTGCNFPSYLVAKQIMATWSAKDQ